MNLKKIIMDCIDDTLEEEEDFVSIVFAQKIENKFKSESAAKIIKISTDELELLTLNELSLKYCHEYEYFIEHLVLKDFYNDLIENKEYNSNIEKIVERVIYYAENDA